MERPADVARPGPSRALAGLPRSRPRDGRRSAPPAARRHGGRHPGLAPQRAGDRPLGLPDDRPAGGGAALHLAGAGSIIPGMASETATPDLLTALLEHIRVLLGADHALYSEWDAD